MICGYIVQDEVIENPDPHFEPIIHLPPVQTKTHEEDEDEMLKLYVDLVVSIVAYVS